MFLKEFIRPRTGNAVTLSPYGRRGLAWFGGSQPPGWLWTTMSASASKADGATSMCPWAMSCSSAWKSCTAYSWRQPRALPSSTPSGVAKQAAISALTSSSSSASGASLSSYSSRTARTSRIRPGDVRR